MHTSESATSIYIANSHGLTGSNKMLHIALICPFSSGPGRGNITTVGRIAGNLPSAGCRVTRIDLDVEKIETCLAALNPDRPDLLHAFHAYHAGPSARRISRRFNIPYLITITGSDLFDPSLCSAPETRLAIGDAAALTCFDPQVAQHLAEQFPQTAERISVIPQGVAPLPLQNPYPRSIDEFLILLPAALRPVKGVIEAIAALAPLAREFPALRLLVAGGALDPDYAEVVSETAVALPWVELLGDVPYQQMGELYAAADLVLNSSLFEGGMANTLPEAMIMGKSVLARNILGNCPLIRHGETGWLFNDDEQLRQLVRRLSAPDLRTKIGTAGRDYVLKYCSPLTEANRYATLYRQILAKAPPGNSSG